MQNKTTTSLVFLLLSGSASLSAMEVFGKKSKSLQYNDQKISNLTLTSDAYLREISRKDGTFMFAVKTKHIMTLDPSDSWTKALAFGDNKNKIIIRHKKFGAVSLKRNINKTNGETTFINTDSDTETLIYNHKNKYIKVLFKDEDTKTLLFNWKNTEPRDLNEEEKSWWDLAFYGYKHFKAADIFRQEIIKEDDSN